MVEKVTYLESEDHPGKTVCIRSAWIDSQIKGFGRAIRAFGYERFKKNCNKMVSSKLIHTYYVLITHDRQNKGKGRLIENNI